MWYFLGENWVFFGILADKGRVVPHCASINFKTYTLVELVYILLPCSDKHSLILRRSEVTRSQGVRASDLGPSESQAMTNTEH